MASAAPRKTHHHPKAQPKWDLANMSNPRVDYWIQRFQTDKRKKFSAILSRKPRYEKMILAKLKKRGMPSDLIYLAMIESGFQPDVRSVAGARGLWQMVPDTARRYGLRVNKKVDERTNPEKSTDAALAYLKDLHRRFGCWYLAAAAYNTGENRVGRVMKKVVGHESGKDKNYYTIWYRLPEQTRDYVPVMIAAARISKDEARYGFGKPSADDNTPDTEPPPAELAPAVSREQVKSDHDQCVDAHCRVLKHRALKGR